MTGQIVYLNDCHMIHRALKYSTTTIMKSFGTYVLMTSPTDQSELFISPFPRADEKIVDVLSKWISPIHIDQQRHT